MIYVVTKARRREWCGVAILRTIRERVVVSNMSVRCMRGIEPLKAARSLLARVSRDRERETEREKDVT